jgi:hypothetical protein
MKPAITLHETLHETSNDNGVRVISFATSQYLSILNATTSQHS